MESNLILLVLFGILGISQTFPQYNTYPNYQFPEQFCSDTVTGKQLYVGEVTTRPGQCTRLQCLDSLQLWEDSCKVPGALKGTCTTLPPSRPNLNFPSCCPLYNCKIFETHAQGELVTNNTYDHTGKLIRSQLAELFLTTEQRWRGGAVGPVRKYQV